MITQSQVKEIIDSGLDPRIKAAREMNETLLLHVEGVGTDEFLARINEYENQGQHNARTKHAISNEFVTEELLRPTDNVFSAKGGSKNYKFRTNQKKNEEILLSILVNVRDHFSLSQYIENIWFQKFITDPNGLIFIETNTDTNKILPTYKSIQSIRAYEQRGIMVPWVIFEPHLIEKDEQTKKEVKSEFWVVDESNYYLYRRDKKSLRTIKKIPHAFGVVPAVICSNIVDNKTGWKKSPIDKQIGLLNKYLTSNSVLTIAEYQSVYYREWEYAEECPKCHGEGMITIERPARPGVINGSSEVVCDACNGSKLYVKQDVTDKTRLRVPRDNEPTIAPPFGIESPPTEGWQLMVDSVDRYFDLIFRSHWNATVEKKDNETATGRFIDVQPVNNRLNKYSTSTELIHSSLVNFFGKYYFPETFMTSTIQYGRRYLIETPDQVWDKYLKAKEAFAPTSELDLLLDQYIESEFKENPTKYLYESKKVALEPFVHWDIKTVRDSQNIYELDKLKKEYFNDWIKTKTQENIINSDIKSLNDELGEYVKQKQQLNESRKLSPIPGEDQSGVGQVATTG